RAAPADAAEAGLGAVAGVAVAAGPAVGDGRVLTTEDPVAGVRRARVAVVAAERDSGLAHPTDARFEAVTEVAVYAFGVNDACTGEWDGRLADEDSCRDREPEPFH